MYNANPSRMLHISSTDDEDQDGYYSDPVNYHHQMFKPPLFAQVVGVGMSLPNINKSTEETPGGGFPEPPSSPMSRRPLTDRSSTLLKKVGMPRRHADMWTSNDQGMSRTKGYILHTDRYQWDELRKSPDSQRRRLEMEMQYMEEMRMQKRKREMVPHREDMDLHMGGRKVVYFERADYMGEIARLKSVALPTRAKDLYVGRGFSTKLPKNHALNRPKPKSPPFEKLRMPSKTPGPTPAPSAVKAFSEGDAGRMSNEPQSWSVTQSAPPNDIHTDDEQNNVEEDRLRATMDITPAPGLPKPPTVPAPTPKAPTPNPLKMAEMEKLVDGEELEKMKQTFKRLDTDMDGHIRYEELKSEVSKDTDVSQEKYIKQVYDLANASTFFGQNEFISLNVMCKKMACLSGDAKEAFKAIDFSKLETFLSKYMDAYQRVDQKGKGTISTSTLRAILTETMDKDLSFKPDVFQKISDYADTGGGHEMSKTMYLALVPYFMTLDKQN